MKQSVFSLPFVAFCGLSCSGTGFYALALIAEPDRLQEYANHCFEVLKGYGIPPDTSKGRKVQDLRYVSWDEKQLIKEDLEPLQIHHFKPDKAIRKHSVTTTQADTYSGSLEHIINRQLQKLQTATVGSRWPTTQHVAYTLGGL